MCGGWEGLGVRVRNRCLYLLSLLEPSSGDRVALLVLQQLLRCLEELVAHVALEHSRDEVDLQVPLVHAARLAHKIAEDALESWGGQTEGGGECEAAGVQGFHTTRRARTHNCLKRRFPNDMNFQSLITPPGNIRVQPLFTWLVSVVIKAHAICEVTKGTDTRQGQASNNAYVFFFGSLLKALKVQQHSSCDKKQKLPLLFSI